MKVVEARRGNIRDPAICSGACGIWQSARPVPGRWNTGLERGAGVDGGFRKYAGMRPIDQPRPRRLAMSLEDSACNRVAPRREAARIGSATLSISQSCQYLIHGECFNQHMKQYRHTGTKHKYSENTPKAENVSCIEGGHHSEQVDYPLPNELRSHQGVSNSPKCSSLRTTETTVCQ